MAIRFWEHFPKTMAAILIFNFISMFILVLAFRCKAKFAGIFLDSKEYKVIKNNELIGYLGSYLLPIVSISLDGSEIQNLFVWIILIILGGIIYIFNNLFHLNPLINIFGYKIYSFEGDKENFIFVTKKSLSHIKSGESLRRVRLYDNIFVEGEL